MSLFVTSLNSGSNGNCYYVGNNTEAILIDAGISCRETEKRMKLLGLSMKIVKAIFISHEHGDHVRGLTTLANKYNLPVYITIATAGSGTRLIKHLSKAFTADEPVLVGELLVTAFTKQHDAVDPHSFIINYKGTTVGVFTDIGKVCKQVVHYFKQCHAAFLEANYDETMLETGRYPIHLKNRIRGGHGHLSNSQALELFTKHRPAFMTHLFLSHLSSENNEPQIVEELFTKHAMAVSIIVASRYQSTALYTISATPGKEPVSVSKRIKPVQLGLFQ
jgi:phosphoribosyl 1,2-cyclic phosphodiesterase